MSMSVEKPRPRLGGEGHTHQFDPISGWCAYCNYRDDGRLVAPGGAVWHEGREYTAQELAALLERGIQGATA